MGAWGIHTFENDSALDWLGDFCEHPSESNIRQTLSPPPIPARTGWFSKWFGGGAGSSIPELDGEEVLAAAEVVATLRGFPSVPVPEELSDLPALQISDDTVALAIEAVDSVLAASNLKDCWEETDDYPAWVAVVQEIRQRLSKG